MKRQVTNIDRAPRQQRGVALILVLWVTILLTVIAGSFAHATRTDINVIHNSVVRAKAEAAADAGLHRAVFELHRPFNDPERWKVDGRPYQFAWQDGSVRVSLQDESAKIDINTAFPELLKGMLLAAGAEEAQAVNLVDAIQDWRDNDAFTRPNGAEEAEYRAAGKTHKPSNVPFQVIEELRLVLGMTPELYRKIAPIITVYSRQPGIDYQSASRTALLAIPGVSAEQVDAFLAQRDAARLAGQPVPPFAPAARFAAAPTQLAVRVKSEVLSEGKSVFTRDAVVRVLPDPKRSFTFLTWGEGAVQDDTAVAGDPAAGAASNQTAMKNDGK